MRKTSVIEELSDAEKAQIVTGGVLPAFEVKQSFSNYGVAIDVGTTTIAARLYDTRGKMLSEASCLNPQSEWGADVISRIEVSLGGRADLLAKVIRNALNDIISQLALKGDIDTKKIDGVVITGNTVMLYLLAAESVEPFSHAPFNAKRLFGETLTAHEFDLSCLMQNTSVYLPPCISAFIGADTICALLATRLCEGDTAMLVDIGTNGEMAIWHNGKLTVCSTAAVPAFPITIWQGCVCGKFNF